MNARWVSGLLLSASLLGLGACTTADVSPTAHTGGNTPANADPSTAENAATPEASGPLSGLRLANRGTTEIGNITTEQTDKNVTVAGSVAQVASLLEGSLYRLQDESGSLWVRSDRPAPRVGETATVEAVVRYEAIVVGQINAGSLYLQEQTYRAGGR
jgi:hypothetical protein